DFVVRTYSSPWSTGVAGLLSSLLLQSFLRPIYYSVETLLGRLRGLNDRSVTCSDGTPLIGIAHKWGLAFDRMSDLFFYPGSGIKPEQMVVYSDDPGRPLTQETQKIIEDL